MAKACPALVADAGTYVISSTGWKVDRYEVYDDWSRARKRREARIES